MVRCSHCGFNEADGSTVCRQCGSALAVAPVPTAAWPAAPNRWQASIEPPSRSRIGVPIIIGVVVLVAIGAGTVVLFSRTSGHAARAASAPEATTTTTVKSNLPIDFGDRPEVAPVNKVFSSITGQHFDRAMFLSAFDLTTDTCGVEQLSLSKDPHGEAPDSTVRDIHAAVHTTGTDTAEVTLSAANNPTSFSFAVRDVGDRWVIDRMIAPPGMPAEFTGSACDIYAILVGASGRAQARAAQADLRNALTAEKTYYTDSQVYDATPADMKAIEPSLDWGGRLQVVVGDATGPGDHGVVCLAEKSANGTTYALADVSAGRLAGTYYGTTGCPVQVTPVNVAALGTSW